MTDLTQGHSPPTLKDVLDAYALEGPSNENLSIWIEAYSHFESELREFTARWIELEALPKPERTSEERSAEARITAAARADRIARLKQDMPNLDALAAAEADRSAVQVAFSYPVVSLDDLIEEAGLTKTIVRKKLGLGFASWAHFRSGMLSNLTERSTEVYHRLLNEVAAILQTSKDCVLKAIPKGPLLPAGFSRAQSRPTAGEQIDIVASLESDSSADPVAVAYYLRQEGIPPSQRNPSNPPQP